MRALKKALRLGLWFLTLFNFLINADLSVKAYTYLPQFKIENGGSADFVYNDQRASYVLVGNIFACKIFLDAHMSNLTNISAETYLQVTLPQFAGKSYIEGVVTKSYALNLGNIAGKTTNLDEWQYNPVIRSNNINFYSGSCCVHPVQESRLLTGLYVFAVIADA